MRRLGLLIVGLIGMATALAAQGTVSSMQVVGTCGTLVLHPGAGTQPYAPATMDSTGKACSSASFSGSVTSRDSVLAKAITVHTCGQRTLSSTGTPENPVGMDTTGALCTNASGGGGGNPTAGRLDSIRTLQQIVLANKTAVAVANNTFTSLRADTLGALIADTLRHIVDSVNASVNIKNSATLTTNSTLQASTAHAARVTIDSGLGLVFATKTQPAIANNTYTQLQTDTAGRLRVKIDTSVALTTAVTGNVAVTQSGDWIVAIDSVPLTTGGYFDSVKVIPKLRQLDSLIGGVLTSKANPANTNNAYSPISADTAGRLRIRLDSALGCLVVAFPSTCPIHVVGDSSHAGYPPGDSLQRADTVIQIDTAYIRAADTCVQSYGGKSARDSITFPAVSGKYIYVTLITAQLTDTLAITGTTHDTVSTTNLRGLGWRCGNAQAVGTNNNCVNLPLGYAIRSTTANTATLITGTAAGTGGYWTLNACGYYHAFLWWRPRWQVGPPTKRGLPEVDRADFALFDPLLRRDAA